MPSVPIEAACDAACGATRHDDPLSAPTVAHLFEEHHVELYRYLVRLTGDADLAADAAQEAFVRLLQRPQLLAAFAATPSTMSATAWGPVAAPPCSPDSVSHPAAHAATHQTTHEWVHQAARAWLYRVATHVALDEARTARRRRGLLAAAQARAPLADPAPATDDLAESRERHTRVASALATLTPRDRTALLMREAGFSHREIAAAVQTTTGAVGTVLARACTKLVTAFGGAREDL